VNNIFNNFNSISDHEKENYIQKKMIERGINPNDPTVGWLISSILRNTDGSQTQVDNYISINLDIIARAEENSREYIKISKLTGNQNSLLNDSQIEEREFQQAIALSLAESNSLMFEGESFAESSKQASIKEGNPNMFLETNKVETSLLITQEEVEEEERELQLALALSLSEESNIENINSNLTSSSSESKPVNSSDLDQVSQTPLENVNKGKGKSK
jgi:Ubiquitin interaction motif